MPKDRLEQRAYRKSPGRQYGCEYDPLRSQSGLTTSKSAGLLVQRPDPRRTRQFLRQSIISSKNSPSKYIEPIAYGEQERQIPSTPLPSMSPASSKTTRRIRYPSQQLPSHEHDTAARPKTTRRIRYPSQQLPPQHPEAAAPSKQSNHRPSSHSPHLAEPYLPATHHAEEIYEETHYPDDDPELDLPEMRDHLYEEYTGNAAKRASIQPPVRRTRHDLPSSALVQQRNIGLREHEVPLYDDYDPNRIYEEDEELPPGLHVIKKQKMSRRGLLVSAGIVAVGGGGMIVASELAPQAVSQIDHTSHAMQEAFNSGVTQGADAARQELVSALDTLEGFTLQGAIDAARLTRMAYDVFVSPVVQIGSKLTSDFLKAMLSTLKTARGWLAGIYQDNATLAALQHVLESWVNQVSKLPKQLDTITQTDLDGAQAYLSALQRKIAEEKNKLGHPHPTPTTPASRSQRTR